jgi:hypothetical protein
VASYRSRMQATVLRRIIPTPTLKLGLITAAIGPYLEPVADAIMPKSRILGFDNGPPCCACATQLSAATDVSRLLTFGGEHSVLGNDQVA